MLAPQAYLLLGGALYGGVGAGIFYSDSDFADRPFYVLRAGLNIMPTANMTLDINANYRFTEWDSDLMQDIDTDTATLSAALRFLL